MTIYDSMGREVMRKALYWYFSYLQVDGTTLENGVYVVDVKGEGISGSVKLVVAR